MSMSAHEPNCSPRPSARDGFIIVAVLWILIALATLASIYSIYIKNSALAISVTDNGLQADALVSASLELTAYRLTTLNNDLRPTRGRFGFRLGRANVLVNFSSETARIDLNAAPKILLNGFFKTLGATDEDADRYADRVIGWRTTPKPAQTEEASLYSSAGLPYLPRGAPFAHASELWLVHGLPPTLVGRAIPFVTVYSGRPEINVFDAPPELIAALPEMTPARLNAFLAQREASAADKDSLSRLLGPDQPGATADGSNAFRVRVSIAFDNGWQTGSEAVILLDTADEPFRVLSWRSDVNADPDQPRLAKRLR
jgi:general secretion pathway protein K